MKTRQFFCFMVLVSTTFALQSCRRTSSDVWEDTKSAGRHMQRGVKALVGSPGDSRQIRSRSDFECIEDEDYQPQGNFQDCDYQDNSYDQNNDYPSDAYSLNQESYNQNANTINNDFIPLQDPMNELAMANNANFRPPTETPGEQGSSIPGLQAFRDPSTIPQLAGIFRPIYFEYNSSLVKGSQNLQTIHAISDFLRYHPTVYVFIEGHTDERGPQAYNLALGSHRANSIRNLLINEGINPDRLFTISYGKERPVVLERHEESWSKNRRGEFKIYER